ncbi:MAG TPA: hypothetical protein VFW92_08955 [Candidatus Limnocylindrales bacterium]|nr:hypothetical protein [Candidatus Limnocylindrales bacterium]
MTTPPLRAPHAEHDALLVARLADGDLTPLERSAAEAQVAACPECARLRDDLRAIGRSLARDLPTPRRPRDFRIGTQVAAPRQDFWQRLRGPWSGLLSPLAGSAAALGLALLLANGGLGGLAASSAAAPAPLTPVAAPAAGPAGGSPEVRAEADPSPSQPPASDAAASTSASASTASAPSAPPASSAAMPSTSVGPSASSGRGLTATLRPVASGLSASPTTIAFSADGRSGAPSPSPLIGSADGLTPASGAPAAPGAFLVLLGWILLLGGLATLVVRWMIRRRRTD